MCCVCVVCAPSTCSALESAASYSACLFAALFFYRDPSFIPKLPLDIAVKYMHTEEKDRMELLKAKVQEKYPVRGRMVGSVGGRVREWE